MRFMLHELARPTPAMGRVIDESVKPLHDRLCILSGRILDLPPAAPRTRLCAQSIMGQIIHYAHHSPVISRLWPELKMSPEQQDMVANHIADFSLSYLQSMREDCDRTQPTKQSSETNEMSNPIAVSAPPPSTNADDATSAPPGKLKRLRPLLILLVVIVGRHSHLAQLLSNSARAGQHRAR